MLKEKVTNKLEEARRDAEKYKRAKCSKTTCDKCDRRIETKTNGQWCPMIQLNVIIFKLEEELEKTA